MIDSSVDGFFKFLNLRHRVYLRKRAKKPWPWTRNKILQTYRFTNVYRDLDAVSVELRRLVLDDYRPWDKTKAAELLGEIITFRFFNWPDTYQLLRPLRGDRWDEDKAKSILRKAQACKQKIFTGAYTVSNNRSTRPKIDIYCEAVTAARKLAPKLVHLIRANRTIENATAIIKEYVPCAGPFVAYEFTSDLRWTKLLSTAPDILRWASAGPGAKRGVHRILCGEKVWPRGQSKPAYLIEMRKLLKESQRPGRLGNHMRPLEIRDIEHGLCEYDKYLRVKRGEGRPRAKYRPPAWCNA